MGVCACGGGWGSHMVEHAIGSCCCLKIDHRKISVAVRYLYSTYFHQWLLMMLSLLDLLCRNIRGVVSVYMVWGSGAHDKHIARLTCHGYLDNSTAMYHHSEQMVNQN